MIAHLAGFFISSVTKFKLFLFNENRIKELTLPQVALMHKTTLFTPTYHPS